MKQHRKFFEKRVNKNAITPEIGDPLAFFVKALTPPPRILAKN
jgi:hypothetical protein